MDNEKPGKTWVEKEGIHRAVNDDPDWSQGRVRSPLDSASTSEKGRQGLGEEAYKNKIEQGKANQNKTHAERVGKTEKIKPSKLGGQKNFLQKFLGESGGNRGVGGAIPRPIDDMIKGREESLPPEEPLSLNEQENLKFEGFTDNNTLAFNQEELASLNQIDINELDAVTSPVSDNNLPEIKRQEFVLTDELLAEESNFETSESQQDFDMNQTSYELENFVDSAFGESVSLDSEVEVAEIEQEPLELEEEVGSFYWEIASYNPDGPDMDMDGGDGGDD